MTRPWSGGFGLGCRGKGGRQRLVGTEHGTGAAPVRVNGGSGRTVFCIQCLLRTGELSPAVRTEHREKSSFPQSSAPVPSLDRTRSVCSYAAVWPIPRPKGKRRC